MEIKMTNSAITDCKQKNFTGKLQYSSSHNIDDILFTKIG